MSLPVLDAPTPDLPLTGTPTPRVNFFQQGDGYSQRTKDGLNSVDDSVTVTWGKLTKTRFDSMVAFFNARAGAEAFLWTEPGEAAPRKWICNKWPRTHKPAARYALTATFQEVFDLDD